MQIYHYDVATGELRSQGAARPNPAAGEEGQPDYLLPAFATEIQPPSVATRQAAIFSDGSWTIVPDLRGVTAYATTTGQLTPITELGKTLAELGLTESAPPPAPPTRDDLKAARQAAVNAIKVTVTSGKEFDGDETSQGRMSRAVQIAQLAGLTSTEWTLANNSVTVVTLAELTEALILSGQEQARLWPLPA